MPSNSHIHGSRGFRHARQSRNSHEPPPHLLGPQQSPPKCVNVRTGIVSSDMVVPVQIDSTPLIGERLPQVHHLSVCHSRICQAHLKTLLAERSQWCQTWGNTEFCIVPAEPEVQVKDELGRTQGFHESSEDAAEFLPWREPLGVMLNAEIQLDRCLARAESRWHFLHDIKMPLALVPKRRGYPPTVELPIQLTAYNSV
jgi:hypothetical protein